MEQKGGSEMRFIKIDESKHGFRLVNIDNIRWIGQERGRAFIGFGNEYYVSTDETIESLERKMECIEGSKDRRCEMIRELLRDQIQRNTDLHLLLSQQIEDVNEARRERDAAWEELSTLKAKLKEEAK
jgi:prefoldin subunit 5